MWLHLDGVWCRPAEYCLVVSFEQQSITHGSQGGTPTYFIWGCSTWGLDPLPFHIPSPEKVPFHIPLAWKRDLFPIPRAQKRYPFWEEHLASPSSPLYGLPQTPWALGFQGWAVSQSVDIRQNKRKKNNKLLQ